MNDPPRTDRGLGAGGGEKGGANIHEKLRKKQAHGVGRRDYRQRLVGGAWGRSLGVRHTMLEEDVGSG